MVNQDNPQVSLVRNVLLNVGDFGLFQISAQLFPVTDQVNPPAPGRRPGQFSDKGIMEMV